MEDEDVEPTLRSTETKKERTVKSSLAFALFDSVTRHPNPAVHLPLERQDPLLRCHDRGLRLEGEFICLVLEDQILHTARSHLEAPAVRVARDNVDVFFWASSLIE